MKLRSERQDQVSYARLFVVFSNGFLESEREIKEKVTHTHTHTHTHKRVMRSVRSQQPVAVARSCEIKCRAVRTNEQGGRRRAENEEEPSGKGKN